MLFSLSFQSYIEKYNRLLVECAVISWEKLINLFNQNKQEKRDWGVSHYTDSFHMTAPEAAWKISSLHEIGYLYHIAESGRKTSFNYIKLREKNVLSARWVKTSGNLFHALYICFLLSLVQNNVNMRGYGIRHGIFRVKISPVSLAASINAFLSLLLRHFAVYFVQTDISTTYLIKPRYPLVLF